MGSLKKSRAFAQRLDRRRGNSKTLDVVELLRDSIELPVVEQTLHTGNERGLTVRQQIETFLISWIQLSRLKEQGYCGLIGAGCACAPHEGCYFDLTPQLEKLRFVRFE
jgi:hypothetical protein